MSKDKKITSSIELTKKINDLKVLVVAHALTMPLVPAKDLTEYFCHHLIPPREIERMITELKRFISMKQIERIIFDCLTRSIKPIVDLIANN